MGDHPHPGHRLLTYERIVVGRYLTAIASGCDPQALVDAVTDVTDVAA